MYISDTFLAAIKGITSNTTRSLLTTLGIIIGVGSVILMISIGNSFENYILEQIDAVGGNTLDVYPKGLERFGKSEDTITFDDVDAIERLGTVTSVASVVFIAEIASFEDEEVSPLIFGTTKEIFDNYGLKLERGRLLEDGDETGAKAVAVISYQTAEDLFGNKDPLGKRIKIGNRRFAVVGTLKDIGSALLQDLNTPIYVPLAVARSITGQKYVSYINVQTTGSAELTQLDITSLLRQRHRIENPDNDSDLDDFMVRSAEQAAEIVGSVTMGLTVFLSLVAGISLLVGGIGIMNIMLVTVTERTKEIGLRKAVGARKRDILLQFLIEAIFLTSIGGLIGMLGGTMLGYMLTTVASSFLGQVNFSLSATAIVLATGMALGTGLVFGLYPAKQAADLNPIQALRKE